MRSPLAAAGIGPNAIERARRAVPQRQAESEREAIAESAVRRLLAAHGALEVRRPEPPPVRLADVFSEFPTR